MRVDIGARFACAVALLVMALPLVPAVAAEDVATVPLYRLLDARNGINFYTTSRARRTQAISVGWVPVSVIGHCLPRPVAGAVKLLAARRERAGVNVFVYSTDLDEVVNLTQNHGWQVENTGIGPVTADPVCWVAPARVVVPGNRFPGTVPLHRLYHPAHPAKLLGGAEVAAPADDDSFYTLSEDEMGSAVRDAGYRYVGVAAHLWPSPATVSVEAPSGPPRIRVPGGGAHTGDPTRELADCTHFLGRADEFLCRTDAAQQRCETLRKAGKVLTCRRAR
jgi:hypothetical protein